jgi:hypothetical protein
MKAAKSEGHTRLKAAHHHTTLSLNRYALPGASILAALLLLGGHGLADTLVQGTVSGVWSNALSPYRLIDTCTVPAGQSLTIEPGVIVKIDSGYSLEVYGTVTAVGTPAAQITFKSRWPSNYWKQIFIQAGGGADSRFSYCNFTDATNAVYLQAYRASVTVATEFQNCNFSNCVGWCVYLAGYAYSTTVYPGIAVHYEPTLSPRFTNCRFHFCANALGLYTVGDYYMYAGYAYAYAHPTIHNNIFDGLADTAIALSPGGTTGSSSAQIANNLFKDCPSALITSDPYDCQVFNNIFQQCGWAVQQSGSLSREVRYNCLFNNQTNFVGYPPVYGRFDDLNANGTTADAFMNIASNPLYAETINYTLSAASACIDAGNPASGYNDVCFPPGTAVNDIGPNGGSNPCACGSSAPAITRQPQSKASCLGGSATFSVEASGRAPLVFQWFFQREPLEGQTNSQLALSNLEATNAGVYFAVVANSFGSATSAPVQLMVNDACVDIHMYAGLNITGQAGQTLVLKYTTDLNNTNFATWTPLATNNMGSSNWFYLDMESPFSPRRFYGVKRAP